MVAGSKPFSRFRDNELDRLMVTCNFEVNKMRSSFCLGLASRLVLGALGFLVPWDKPDYKKRIAAYKRLALEALARNDFEQAAVRLICPNALLQTEDADARRFLFRCFFVPQSLAALEINAGSKFNLKPGDPLPPWWVFEAASYRLAFERTFLEMVLARAKKGRVEIDGKPWEVPELAERPANVPEPSLEVFLECSSEAAVWEARFDQWRASNLCQHFI